MRFTNVIRALVLILFIGLLVSPLFNCDPMDPKNSVNAIHLDDPTMIDHTPRFEAVYHSKNYDVEVYVYKDLEHPGSELIVVMRKFEGIAATYVVHPVRDTNIRIEP